MRRLLTLVRLDCAALIIQVGGRHLLRSWSLARSHHLSSSLGTGSPAAAFTTGVSRLFKGSRSSHRHFLLLCPCADPISGTRRQEESQGDQMGEECAQAEFPALEESRSVSEHHQPAIGT